MENRSERNPKYSPGESGKDSVPDLDALLNGAVRVGTGIGSTVLSGIADVLDHVGQTIHAARTPPQEIPFPQWKRKLDRRLQNGGQGEGLALAITGGILAGLFGVTAITMWALSAAGPQALGIPQEEFIVFPILMACFTPITVGFGIMTGAGVKKYRYVSRLRSYLRVARDWVCTAPALARDSGVKLDLVRKDLRQAVAQGDFPNALLEADDTLYLDLEHCAPEAPAASQPEPERTEEPLDDARQLQRQGTDFLEYLRRSTGKLGLDADEELTRMDKNCAAILGFVHNHPEMLPRVRRFQEYYLPTTRKLLDIAQGLGDTDVRNAQEIRRDITGILHTLNLAYSKLYDTLLQDVSLDVSTEIDTLETMLRQDGLTHDFEMDFKQG